MNKLYFPRGNAEWKEEHEPIATTQWVSSAGTLENFAYDQKLQNPFIFGKLQGADGKDQVLVHDDDAHVVTIAGSRAGKGVSLIIPNLLSYHGSAIVIDPKGENATVTAQWREDKLKQKVIVLDPFGETDFVSNSFNPLLFLDAEGDEFMDDINDLAEALIVRGNGNDPHWDESARSMIKMILKYIVMDHDISKRNLTWLRKLLLVGQSKSEKPFYKKPTFEYDDEATEEANEEYRLELEEEIIDDQEQSFKQFLKNLSKHRDVFIKGTAQRFLQAGEKEVGSIISTTQRNTEFLDSPPICATLEKNDFDLSILRAGATIYLVLPEIRLAGQSRWLRLLLTVFLRHLQMDKRKSESDPSVLIVLDECAALGYMQVIERAAGYIAGFGVKLWSIWQDLSQLKKNYRDSWETFIGNAGTFTAFGNVDLTTREYISKYLGQCETPRVEESTTDGTSHNENRAGLDQMMKSSLASVDAGGGKGSSASYNKKPTHVISPLLLPEEVGRYFGKSTGKILALFGQGQPVCADRIIYYEDEPFNSRAETNPLYKK